MNLTPDTVPAERDPSRPQAEFMPSCLLDTKLAALSVGQGKYEGLLVEHTDNLVTVGHETFIVVYWIR